MRTLKVSLATLAVAAFSLPGHAATVYLTPSTQSFDVSAGTASFDLLMNFSANESTVGGGLDLDFSGPATFAGFTPSSYFTGTADPAFSGYGTERADNDLEIHFGSFNGLSGVNNLGRLTFNFSTPGQTNIGLGINSFWGDFYSVSGTRMDVGLTGATLSVTAVPEPQTVALMFAGLAFVGALARRRSAVRD